AVGTAVNVENQRCLAVRLQWRVQPALDFRSVEALEHDRLGPNELPLRQEIGIDLRDLCRLRTAGRHPKQLARRGRIGHAEHDRSVTRDRQAGDLYVLVEQWLRRPATGWNAI